MMYVVVTKVDNQDWEPCHPGSTDKASAQRLCGELMADFETARRKFNYWTQDKWNRYEDDIAEEMERNGEL